MKVSKNEKVQKFLNDLILVDNEKFKLLIEIREIIFSAYLKIDEKVMYGGIIFFLNNEMFSGVKSNKNHITIEFSKGFMMKDPNKFLEGSGKFRRHLKIRTKADIKNKEVIFFVKQAF
jgi:hypothetical protein